MTMSKRLRLAISLAPLLGALALPISVRAAPPGGGQQHFQGGSHGDFHRGFHDRHDHDRFGFGFGFGFWDPWWGPADYWGYYPYPYYDPYYYPPYPAYYAAPPTGYPPSGGYAPPPGSASDPPAQASVAPPPQYWYYCDSPQGYYPYVQDCSATWKQVAATPPSGSGNTISPRPKQ